MKKWGVRDTSDLVTDPIIRLLFYNRNDKMLFARLINGFPYRPGYFLYSASSLFKELQSIHFIWVSKKQKKIVDLGLPRRGNFGWFENCRVNRGILLEFPNLFCFIPRPLCLFVGFSYCYTVVFSEQKSENLKRSNTRRPCFTGFGQNITRVGFIVRVCSFVL